MIIRFLTLSLVALLIAAGSSSGQPGTPGGPPPEQGVILRAPAGTPNFGQVTVGPGATLLRAANTNRSTITVVNHGSTNVFIGFTSGVTSSTGAMLVGVPGSSLVISTRSDIWGVTASGTQVVGFLEEIR